MQTTKEVILHYLKEIKPELKEHGIELDSDSKFADTIKKEIIYA